MYLLLLSLLVNVFLVVGKGSQIVWRVCVCVRATAGTPGEEKPSPEIACVGVRESGADSGRRGGARGGATAPLSNALFVRCPGCYHSTQPSEGLTVVMSSRTSSPNSHFVFPSSGRLCFLFFNLYLYHSRLTCLSAFQNILEHFLSNRGYKMCVCCIYYISEMHLVNTYFARRFPMN